MQIVGALTMGCHTRGSSWALVNVSSIKKHLAGIQVSTTGTNALHLTATQVK